MVAQVPVLDHPAEAELFADVLTCETWLPASYRAGDRQLPPQAGEALLRSIATAEDARSSDDGDERNELPQAFQRLEAKVDLMLSLIGRLARQQADALPVRAVRWSHNGLRIDAMQAWHSHLGDAGVALIEPANWLSDHLELPARVMGELATPDGQHHLWLRFAPLSPGLSEALDRHLFRLHRKQIAEARQARQS
jgi:hypothetical protein